MPAGTHARPAPWLRPPFHPFQGKETPSWSPAGLSRACRASLHLCSLRRTERVLSGVEQTPRLTFHWTLTGPEQKPGSQPTEILGHLKSGFRSEACGWTSISRVSVQSSAHKHFCHGLFLPYSTVNQELLLLS